MPNYYDNWKEAEYICPKCGWRGNGHALEQGNLDSVAVEFRCPACKKSAITVFLPTIQEARANWEKLSALEKQQVMSIEQHTALYEQQKLKNIDQLPDIPDDGFTLTWDHDPDARLTLIMHGDQVLHSEPAWYECYERFEEVALILRQKYGKRIHDLCPTEQSMLYLYGDRIAAPDRINRFRRKIFDASDDTDGGATKNV